MLAQLFQILQSAVAQAQQPPRLKISDPFPDVRLVNQFGEPIRFRKRFVDDGRALIVNTMYTTCRGSCPSTSVVLKSLRDVLSPIFGRRLSIVSITLDPTVDQPEELLSYAANFRADQQPERLCEWQFLTGHPKEIESLRRALGFYDLDPKVDQDVTQHASTLLVGNSTTDRWAAIPAEIQRSQLVSSICRVAGFTFEQKYGIRS